MSDVPQELKDWLDVPQEELLPELADCVVQTTMFPMVKHPLVNAIALPMGGSWYHLNELYRRKSEAMNEAIAANNWTAILGLTERPWRVETLHGLAESIPPEDLNRLVCDIWSDTEQEDYNASMMLDLLARTGFVTDAEELPEVLRSEEEVTVYRGEGLTDGSLANGTGIAWSLERRVAEWFARRFQQDASVAILRARVRRADILAYITARSEAEVIIEPSNVYEVEEIAI
jgi:hypothetical protein